MCDGWSHPLLTCRVPFGNICELFSNLTQLWAYFLFSTSVSVQFWEHDRYLTTAENGPPSLIDLRDLESHAVRDTIHIKTEKVWVTVLRKQVSVHVYNFA